MSNNSRGRQIAALCFRRSIGVHSLTLRGFFESVYGISLEDLLSTASQREAFCKEVGFWLGVTPNTTRRYWSRDRVTGAITETLPAYHGRALWIAYRGLKSYSESPAGQSAIQGLSLKRTA